MKKALILSAICLAAPAFASASVFDRSQARSFCTVPDTAVAENCLSDQEQAGRRIDAWLNSGCFTRVGSRHAFERCDARYRPDLRQTWICLDRLRDDSRRKIR